MKKLNQILVISFCLSFHYVKAQSCCLVAERKKDTTFMFPKLIDTGLFITDLKNKVDLKSVYDSLNRKSESGMYMYAFDINEQGKLEPRLYYNENSPEMKNIQQFVETIFNQYKWEPGYKKKCISCKLTIYLQFKIYLNTDKGGVGVEIEDEETTKEIFYAFFPYKRLKSFP